MSLAQLYLSGETRRWHANPAMAGFGQTVADHQCRATQLLLALHPAASSALVYACLHHDVGEAWAGDLPQPFKARCPDFAAQHAAIEADFVHSITGAPLPYLTGNEARWLKLVDGLEAMAFTICRNPGEFVRDRSGWPDALASLTNQAVLLGCKARVMALIDDLLGGEI